MPKQPPPTPVASAVGPCRIIIQISWLVSQGSWVRCLVWQHTFVSASAFSRRAVVSYWRKYVHKVLVNRLGDLSLPRKSVVRLTDCSDMTLDVYLGRKTTMQQIQISRTPLHWKSTQQTTPICQSMVAVWARLFKTNDVVSKCFVKISNSNI